MNLFNCAATLSLLSVCQCQEESKGEVLRLIQNTFFPHIIKNYLRKDNNIDIKIFYPIFKGGVWAHEKIKNPPNTCYKIA